MRHRSNASLFLVSQECRCGWMVMGGNGWLWMTMGGYGIGGFSRCVGHWRRNPGKPSRAFGIAVGIHWRILAIRAEYGRLIRANYPGKPSIPAPQSGECFTWNRLRGRGDVKKPARGGLVVVRRVGYGVSVIRPTVGCVPLAYPSRTQIIHSPRCRDVWRSTM